MMQVWARGALALAVVTQAVWVLTSAYQQRSFQGLFYSGGVTLGFAVLAFAGDRLQWIAPLLRIFIGVAFLSAIADRLGIFGGPGTPGVSWGNFHKFEIYTGQVNAFLPAGVIPALAVVESFVEGVLGVLMLIGLYSRRACTGSACLLAMFAVAMTLSLGFKSQFPYAVLVLAAGSWLLATRDATSRCGIDALGGLSKAEVRKRGRLARGSLSAIRSMKVIVKNGSLLC